MSIKEPLFPPDFIAYDADTGEFTWKKRRRGAKLGGVCGTIHPEGYKDIRFDGRSFKGASMAWLCMTGFDIPDGYVGHHIDGDRTNCSWSNLCLKKKSPSWSQEDMLSYDPATGAVSWNYDYDPNSKPLRNPAGFINNSGYVRIGVGGGEVFAHRLAYKAMTGHEVPDGMDIDHINGDRTDNRWVNLRVVSRSQNNMNAKIRVDNKSGVKGVTFDKRRGKWAAEIRANNKKIFLGRFDTIEEAAEKRKLAESEMFGQYSYERSRGNT